MYFKIGMCKSESFVGWSEDLKNECSWVDVFVIRRKVREVMNEILFGFEFFYVWIW